MWRPELRCWGPIPAAPPPPTDQGAANPGQLTGLLLPEASCAAGNGRKCRQRGRAPENAQERGPWAALCPGRGGTAWSSQPPHTHTHRARCRGAETRTFHRDAPSSHQTGERGGGLGARRGAASLSLLLSRCASAAINGNKRGTLSAQLCFRPPSSPPGASESPHLLCMGLPQHSHGGDSSVTQTTQCSRSHALSQGSEPDWRVLWGSQSCAPRAGQWGGSLGSPPGLPDQDRRFKLPSFPPTLQT